MAYYQGNHHFSIIGAAKEQQGFGLYFKNFMQDAFYPQPIGALSTSKSPFYAYVEASPSKTISIDGKLIELSFAQQGFIATYRFAVFKNHKDMLDSLESGVDQVLTSEQRDLLLPKVKDLLFDLRAYLRTQYQ